MPWLTRDLFLARRTGVVASAFPADLAVVVGARAGRRTPCSTAYIPVPPARSAGPRIRHGGAHLGEPDQLRSPAAEIHLLDPARRTITSRPGACTSRRARHRNGASRSAPPHVVARYEQERGNRRRLTRRNQPRAAIRSNGRSPGTALHATRGLVSSCRGRSQPAAVLSFVLALGHRGDPKAEPPPISSHPAPAAGGAACGPSG